MQVEEDLVARSDVGQSDSRVVAATCRIALNIAYWVLGLIGRLQRSIVDTFGWQLMKHGDCFFRTRQMEISWAYYSTRESRVFETPCACHRLRRRTVSSWDH
jgi:hypothetical protein